MLQHIQQQKISSGGGGAGELEFFFIKCIPHTLIFMIPPLFLVGFVFSFMYLLYRSTSHITYLMTKQCCCFVLFFGQIMYFSLEKSTVIILTTDNYSQILTCFFSRFHSFVCFLFFFFPLSSLRFLLRDFVFFFNCVLVRQFFLFLFRFLSGWIFLFLNNNHSSTKNEQDYH